VCKLLLDYKSRYKDIIYLTLIVSIGYILIKNYNEFFAFIRGLISIISPFIYALIIAYCLNPLMMLFEKRLKLNRRCSTALTYISILALVTLGCIYIIPNIIDSIISIASDFPRYIEVVQGWTQTVMENETLQPFIKEVDFLDKLADPPAKLVAVIIDALDGIVSSIIFAASSVIKIAIGFLISIYVLLDKEKLSSGSKMLIYMLLKEENGNRVIEWARIYHRMVGLYIGTKAIDSAIVGFIAFIGLLIIGAPYPVLLALIVGVTNMVPYLGPFVGEVIGALIGLFISPMMSFKIFIFLFALQQFDAWYLDPKLIGKKVGVKPFFIILALTIGGGYFGIVGMLLASPTIATLKLFYDGKVSAFKAGKIEFIEYIDNDKIKLAGSNIKYEEQDNGGEEAV
jgi:predicted PurR-regulated permease PerM